MNSALESALEELPQQVADALLEWRKATLSRERLEAITYLNFKSEFPDMTATEIKAKVNSSQERYDAVLKEVTFESIYKAKEETLLAKKKEASLRSAF